MTGSLEGKVAIVSGGGRGLGREIALGFGRAGADVVVAARGVDALEGVVSELGSRGRPGLAVQTDITDEGSVAELVARTIERFGQVDIVVNNSGILHTGSLLEQTADDWDRVIATNLRGVFLLTREAGRQLVAQGSGKVINIASHFALMGVAQHAAYSSSKAAVIAFTRAMAVEWARHGVQVNAIAPGYFATELNAEMRSDDELTARVVRAVPLRRMGRAEEIAPWALLLAGAESDFMTGEVIVLDGGQSVP